MNAGTIQADPNQKAVINWLDDYSTNLLVNLHQIKRYKYDFEGVKGKGLTTVDTEGKAFQKIQQNYKELDDIKSIYLWGDPGCGKSFMAEQFFEHLKIDPK